MRCFFSPHSPQNLPASHPAQIERFALLRDLVITEQFVTEKKIHRVSPAPIADLTNLHCEQYLAKIESESLSQAELTLLGFPSPQGLLDYGAATAQATHLTCLSALEEGCAVSLSGTQPHATHNQGQNFSVCNDIAYAISRLHQAQPSLRIMVLNTSAHPCHGLHSFLTNSPNTYLYSLHSLSADAPTCGNMDISLPRYAEDYVYQPRLLSTLANAFSHFSPELVIWIAGVDAQRDDTFGEMYLSKHALAERDAHIAHTLLKHQMPLATLIGPGSNLNAAATASLHLQTIRALHLANHA